MYKHRNPQLSEVYDMEVQQDPKPLLAFVDSIEFFAKQGLSLRDHNRDKVT